VLLNGEQGTGKTTAGRLLSALIDPSSAQVRGTPRDLEGWALAASGSWVVVLDNLSSIREWLSDAICRACTGEGMVRRTLYSDDGLSVLSFRRAIVLTAIDAGSLRGDLGDRLAKVELNRIAPEDRRPDKDIADAFAAAHPAILGALLDLFARVLSELPKVDRANLPRMADFARVLIALDRVTGWRSLDAYTAMGTSIATDVVAGDDVVDAVAQFALSQGTWTGTATELLKEITTSDRPPRDWPRAANALSGRLKRAAPALRAVGVGVIFGQRGSTRRAITLTTTTDGDRDRSSPSSSPSSRGDRPERGSLDGLIRSEPVTVISTVTNPSATELDERRNSDGDDGHDDRLPQLSVWESNLLRNPAAGLDFDGAGDGPDHG